MTFLVGFSLNLSSIIYAKNCRFSDSRATRFSSRRKRDASGNLLINNNYNDNKPVFLTLNEHVDTHFL